VQSESFSTHCLLITALRQFYDDFGAKKIRSQIYLPLNATLGISPQFVSCFVVIWATQIRLPHHRSIRTICVITRSCTTRLQKSPYSCQSFCLYASASIKLTMLIISRQVLVLVRHRRQTPARETLFRVCQVAFPFRESELLASSSRNARTLDFAGDMQYYIRHQLAKVQNKKMCFPRPCSLQNSVVPRVQSVPWFSTISI